MAIKGLTDRNLAFPQIGNIRKGEKVTKVNAEGKTVSFPHDLKYFKVEFDAQEGDREQAFREVYHDKPTEINIRIPFNQIDRCWDPFCEAYTAGRMVARSDGEFFSYLVNLTTGAMEVVNGVNDKGEKVPHREIIGKAGKTDIKCRPVGRLKVIIPELRSYAYLVVHTTSVIDIRNISEQLAAIQYANDGNLIGVPLILRRRPKMVSTPTADGKRTRLEKWMLSIEVDPKWVAARFAQLELMALPSGASKPALPDVPEDTPETGEDWSQDEGAPPEESGAPIEAEYTDRTDSLEGEPNEPPLADLRRAAWPEEPKVSLTMAESVRTGDTKEAYLDIPREIIAKRLEAIKNTLANNHLTEAQREANELRRDVAQIILDLKI